MTTQEELNDILTCISIFDPSETLKNKGRYFEVIQKDVIKLLAKCQCPECLQAVDKEELDMFGGICEGCANIDM